MNRRAVFEHSQCKPCNVFSESNEPLVLLGLPLEFGGAPRGGLPLLHGEPVRGASATVPRGRRQTGHLVIMVAGGEQRQKNESR